MLTDYTHMQLLELHEKQLERSLEQRRRHAQRPRPSWRSRAARSLNRLADRLDRPVTAGSRLTDR